ncbi:MAG TPA: DUF6125 family protein [Bacteroidales bacterium]|nr:DUF6125 family protein [Bacteroidales bacterium]HRW97243.1 DUF6125 family protein [Bacteroidales bacterium]
MSSEINHKNLSKQDNVKLILDFFHRTMMHHAMWFAEVQHQFGRGKALEAMETAWQRSYSIQMKRIAKTLDFEVEEDLPKPLLDLPDEQLNALREAMAVNWLANDGVWFQAVEFTRGMNDAKRCNDSCWGQFSPFEAWSIKRYLDLPEKAGLEGLKKALQFRLYAFINEQSFVEETANSFVFQMNQCRVQNARKRKGLADYPCKSGGLVEYTTFAEAIDSRIKTECMACPPDPHPQEYFCAWRFSISE